MQPLNRPIICPVLVGRDAHLAVLDESLGQLAAGHGQTLLIAGEAGIGKSRLLSETRTRAAERGLATLTGHAFESHRTVPYAPLIEVLRSVILHRPGNERPGGPSPVALGQVAPELRRLVPEFALTSSGPARPPDVDQAEPERHQIFRALVDTLRQLSDGRPAVIIIEDAHWADDASLDFLGYLAHQLDALPILLLITYRDDEPTPALSKLLADLDRRRLASELRLARLGREEVAAAVQAIFALPRPARPDFLDAIYALTDGNPFFVEESLRALIVAGDLDVTCLDGALRHQTAGRLRIPRSVRDAVQRRVDLLSGDAHTLLVTGAVIGQQFDLELAGRVCGLDEICLLSATRKLLAAGLVVEAADDQLAFRHALTRAAILDGLLGRERRALHRAVGEALERALDEPLADRGALIADIAQHVAEAGQWDRVVVYAPQAGARAQALYAPRAAVEQYTRALEAAAKLGAPAPLDMLRARGRAYETLGDFEAARADLEAALVQATAGGDARASWRAQFDLGVAWMGRSYERSSEYLRAALALARQLDPADPVALGRTLNALGNLHTNFDEPDRAIHLHQDALEEFRTLEERRGLAETLDFLGMASFLAGDAISACARLTEAIDLFRALDLRQGLASALATRAIASGSGHLGDLMALPDGDPAQQQSDAETALRIAREIQWRAGEAYVLNCVASTHAARGRYARALGAAHEAMRLAEELGHQEWTIYTHCTLGTLHFDLLAFPEAQLHYDTAASLAPASGSQYWERFSGTLAALCCIARGDLERAATLMNGAPDPQGEPRTWAGRSLYYAGGRLALASGDAERALALADALLAADAGAKTEWPARRALHLRGDALAALGRVDEASQALRLARALAVAREARPALWRIEASIGRLAVRQGDLPGAEVASVAARAIIDELAEQVSDEALRERFMCAAAALLLDAPDVQANPATARSPSRTALSARAAAKLAAGGLTAREREVAVLVGRGLTNREIAAALVLGERTVQSHVSHVLGKLGFATRAQIAVWAADRGLLDGASHT